MADGATRSLRITFVALNYPPSVGGAQEHVRRLAEGLAADGHRVRVVTTDLLRAPASGHPDRLDDGLDRAGDVEVERCAVGPRSVRLQRAARALARRLDALLRPARPLYDWPWLSGPWSPALVRAVVRAVRRDDVVVACSAPFLTLLVPPLAARRGGARVVALPLLHVDARGPRPAVVRALRRSHRIVTSTDFEASVVRGLGIAPDLVDVVAPGTDLDRFDGASPTAARRRAGLPERRTVGFVGRIAAYKGVDALVAAAPALWSARPDVGVLVAGSTTGWAGHRDPALRAVGGDRYVVREDVDADELALLVAACDVVVHPSREESFGLTALDAWAAGRPVVLGDLGCTRSFARPGVDALLVAPSDPDELLAAVLALLDDDEQREAMGAAGRRAVEERFTWEAAVEGWSRVVATAGVG